MQETNHDNLRYRGKAGEHVTVRVTASDDTVHLVTYVLDGQLPAKVLPKGESIEFDLKNSSGAVTRLQINLDFAPSGSYDVVVENVAGCPFDVSGIDECPNPFFGSSLVNPVFTFTVQ